MWSSRETVALLHEMVFLIDRRSCRVPYNGKILAEILRSSINFHGRPQGVSQISIANVLCLFNLFGLVKCLGEFF